MAVRTRRWAVAGLVGSAGLTGCTDWAGYDLDYLWGAISPALGTLRGSVSYDPYEMPRLPAENTVPVSSPNGDVPRFAAAQLDSAAATLTNPLAGSTDPAVLARGAAMYNNQCVVCHGPQGAGNGPVVGAGKYPFAPAINGAATAGRSDGYLYGVIAVGRGLMPAYGEKLSHLDRWAVVNYVRQLQQQAGPLPQATAGAQPAGAAPAAPAAPAQAGQPSNP